MEIERYLVAMSLAALIAGAAYWAKALSVDGAVAAFCLGAVVFGVGGIAWAVILLAFFITSSGFSFLFKKNKLTAEEKFAKGSRRDAGQVLANGGIAWLAVLVHGFFPDLILPWVAFAAAFAAANADTWATELGVLSRTQPRLLTTWKSVPGGTSGAVSLAGSFAMTGGALLIAVLALLVWPLTELDGTQKYLASMIILLSGLAGSLVDSWLGAKVQAIYYCPDCRRETEKHPYHSCGTVTEHWRGWRWLNNDGVNMLCTGSAALLALILVLVFH